MKVALLHLSDLHIDRNNHQWLINRTNLIVSAVRNDFLECDKIIIVVSGDIVFSGKEEQYGYAKLFFKALLRSFAENNLGNTELENTIVCVPGNHDCNFDNDNKARSLLINGFQSDVSMIDQSVYDSVSVLQTEYQSFAKDIMINKDFKLSINNDLLIKVKDRTILFRLYNTSWMSSLNEHQNSIVMPMNIIAQEKYNADLAISIFHHHYSWLTPACDNNKNAFRKHVLQTSNMVIFGHEHTPSSSQIKDHYEGEIINEFEGGTLCSDNKGGTRESTFNSFIIDLDTFYCIVRSHEYTRGIYSNKREETIDLNRERKTDEFRHNDVFMKSLKKMSIPIHNSENTNMTLDEFFVFPDLEHLNTKNIKVDEDFIDSSTILDDNQYSLVILEGDNQSGKSSLLNMIYLCFVDRYLYPILIEGKHIVNDKLDKIIANAFALQYNSNEYERYSQYDKTCKIMLIDNFDECILNDTAKNNIINRLLERFHKVILTTKENEKGISSYYLMEKKDALLARIKPLGHLKRNELVKKFYLSYNANSSIMQRQVLLEQVKAGFDMVENFLGKEYMPSYPIYILSILLSHTKIQGNTLEQTSYGHCYEALIICALMTCVGDRSKIDRYYNVLMSLAYFVYNKNGKAISEMEFEEFYKDYQNTYIAPGYKEIKNNLLKCNLLKCTDEYYYKFSYNYIYYFLVAKYMASNIHSDMGLNDILDLCVNIHDEQKANILVFIAHHIKNPQFIEATQLALTSALEVQKPVTLKRGDQYYILLDQLCESLKKEIVSPEEKIDPEKERERMLKQLDERDKLISRDVNNMNDTPIEIQNVNKSLRSIEVVGQIVKNRQGSLPKTDIKVMVKQMYETAFRTISYFGSIIEAERSQMIEDIIRNKKEGFSDDDIKKKLDAFFEITSLNFCLFVFSKIINSVGTKELRATFTQVAEEIDTPAAKLVSFSIISCFSKIAIQELKELVEDLNDNPVAMSIIRARVRSYLYNNHVSFSDRQRIIQTVNLNPKDGKIIANRHLARPRK